MKKLSEQEKKTVQEFAEMALSALEIQTITGLDRNSEDFRKAFQTGILLVKAKVHKSIITLAENGSAPAQAMADKLILSAQNKR